jgi:DNA-binding transcriptional MerR regulator
VRAAPRLATGRPREASAEPSPKGRRAAGNVETVRREPANETEERARELGHWPYKMADLSKLTGMPRQAIHFYIHEGLVPRGHKTGRNSARYGEEHLERIRIVKRLQSERFLPLKAIRAVLDGRDDAFTPEQLGTITDVKRRLASTLGRPRSAAPRLDVRALLEHNGLSARDLDDLVRSRVVDIERGPRGAMRVSADEAWAFEMLGEVRRAGFAHELGFDAKLLRVYERAVASLVETEWQAVAERLSGLPPEAVAAMIEKAMPLVHEFFARYHAKKVRDFFASER